MKIPEVSPLAERYGMDFNGDIDLGLVPKDVKKSEMTQALPQTC